jgi:hypothetical protein
MILASSAVPPDWALRCGGGPLTIGNDVATTEKKTSNPSAFCVMEKLNGIYWQRLVVRFKSEDPEVSYAVIKSILDARPASEWRCLNIDASSERYHAQNVRRRFRARLRVNLIVNSENIVFEKEKFTFKSLLGDLYVSAFEDGIIALPPDNFILGDHRLVKKQAGGYVTEVDEEGNHGDTFDGGKLAYWGHQKNGSGKARARAAAVGGQGITPGGKNRPGLFGNIARQLGFGSHGSRLNS